MPIITNFGKILCKGLSNELIQVDINDIDKNNYVRHTMYKNEIILHDFGFFNVEKSNKDFFIKKNDLYLSASDNLKDISLDRPYADTWETFHIIDDFYFDEITPIYFTDLYLKKYEFGYLEETLKNLIKLNDIFPNNDYIEYHINFINRSNLKNKEHNVIFNCDIDNMFEKQWLNEIFPEINIYDEFTEKSAFYKNIIIIDSNITKEKVKFYKKLFENKNNITLIHLSDESFNDDHNCYRYCNVVWRNLYNPILATRKNINFFPLGYKNGFSCNVEERKCEDRDYVWFFAGDIKKSNRKIMYENMKKVKRGYSHLTTFFNSSDALDVKTYRDFMDKSIFIPCPAGFIHLDSFRIYEALEAGCIPIIENGRGVDCFSPYLNSNPLPMINSWDEAPKLIEDIINSGKQEEIRSKCSNWWKFYKNNIKNNIKYNIKNINNNQPFW